MLLTEDKEIIDIYNSRILKEGIQPAKPRELIEKLKLIPRVLGKHIDGHEYCANSGSLFIGYQNNTNRLIEELHKCTWSTIKNAGGGSHGHSDWYYETENFGGYAINLVKNIKDFNGNDIADLDLNNNILQATKKLKEDDITRTQVVTLIFTENDEPKTIHPGHRGIGRNNIGIKDKNDLSKSKNVCFIPFARIKEI